MENFKNIEIKNGINLNIINTNKFKTNLFAIFLTTKLNSQNITSNALIPAILKRGTQNMTTQDEISIALEELYGASFDCGVDKIGDNQVLKFYLETINNDFLPDGENTLKDSINILLDIVFNPLIEAGKFKEEYIENEKKNLRQIIEGRKDSKATYAIDRCIEEMYNGKDYALYKYGNINDLEEINASNLYNKYLELIKNCKIDIYISGDIKENIQNEIINNYNIKKLDKRIPNYIINNMESRKKEKVESKEIFERMDITQGKLIIGLDILNEKENDKFIALVYNAILGGTPTSKMFQNVREKNSLAYTASSSFIKQKANILVKCGIDIQNYNKAVDLIKEQIENMKNGKFTEQNIEEAKTNIISTIKFIPDEQDTELMYHLAQELSGYKMEYEEYIREIEKINRDDITELANRVQINTIYFLKN